MDSRTYKVLAVVLKRINIAEADRIITLYSLEYGKITALAKGVRKITSSRKSSVEPGTEAEFFLARGKTFDFITQTRLIRSHSSAYTSLVSSTLLFQFLEIIDHLTVEQQENDTVYHLLRETLDKLDTTGMTRSFVLEQIRLVLKALGFTYDKQFTEAKLKAYIEELSQKRLKSKPYLSPTTRQ
jgi:DNA repair protein RecO (recombination protein O)